MQSNTSSKAAKPQSAGPQLLPVVDICNNLMTVSGYLSAIQSAILPQQVVTANPTLATSFTDWQTQVWQQYVESLMNLSIMAEVELVNELVSEGVSTQSSYVQVFNPTGGPIPPVLYQCEMVMNWVTQGAPLLSQLQTVATGIQGADKTALANLQSIVNTLNSQFDSLEQQLTDKALDDGKEIVMSMIDVGVAVATDGDPIAPLLKGVAQVGFNIVSQLEISAEINATLSQLESAWQALDAETTLLAEVTLVIQQLQAVSADASQVLTALNNISNDWQQVLDVVNGSASEWTATGFAAIKEWGARMALVNYPMPFTQVVTPQ